MIEVEISPKGICDLCRAIGISPIDPTVHRIVSGDIIMLSLCAGHAKELRTAIRAPKTSDTPPPKKEPVIDRLSRKLTRKCGNCIK